MSTRAPSPDQVRAALDELLGWSEVIRSPQLSKFLKHIVDAKLRGDEASIKAYSIAVDVFGRPPSFDPQTDPIVRVQARRLRGLLQEFYRQHLDKSGVQITLPVGRYVPEFELAGPTNGRDDNKPAVAADKPVAAAAMAPAPTTSHFRRRFWTQAIAAMSLVLLLGLLLFGLQVLRTPEAPIVGLPEEPAVYISDFSNLTGIATLDTFTSRLNDQMGSILAQFEDVQVGFVEPGTPVAKVAGSFVLSGSVDRVPTGIKVSAILTDTATDAAVWSGSFGQPLPAPDGEAAAMTAARNIIRELGPFRGPVHAQGRHWLDENTLQIPAVNGYICMLTYRYAREFANPAAIAKAIDCHDRLLRLHPDLPLAIAASAWLQGRVTFDGAGPGERLDLALAKPAELAERAQHLAPESSFVHEQLAGIQNWQEKFDTAQRNYAIALGFGPLNTDARANHALTLARAGDWSGAAQQAQFAIADTPFPSPWYYYVPSMVALREDRLSQAIEDGRIAAEGGEIGAILVLAAGGLAGDTQAISDFQARVLSSESLRRHGILPWLRIRIKDEALVAKLAEGLRAGGIPELSLTSQF